MIRGYQVLLSESQKSAVSAYFEIQHRCGRCAESMQRLHQIWELLDAELDVIKIRTHVVMIEWINNLS